MSGPWGMCRARDDIHGGIRGSGGLLICGCDELSSGEAKIDSMGRVSLQLQYFQQAPALLLMLRPKRRHGWRTETASPEIASPLEPKAGNSQNFRPRRGSSTATLMPVEQIASGSCQSPCRMLPRCLAALQAQAPALELHHSLKTLSVIRTSLVPSPLTNFFPCHSIPSSDLDQSAVQPADRIATARQTAAKGEGKAGSCCCTRQMQPAGRMHCMPVARDM